MGLRLHIVLCIIVLTCGFARSVLRADSCVEGISSIYIELEVRDLAHADQYGWRQAYPSIESDYSTVVENLKPTDVISIVMPAYNESARLPNSLIQLRSFLDEFPLPVEVLVIVEKSTDNTVDLATAAVGADPRIKVIDNQVHRGKGYAVRSGMKLAKGDYVFFMDSDLSTPLPEIINFLRAFQTSDAQVIIGRRKGANSEVVKEQGFLRKVMGKTFQAFTRYFTKINVEDTQCGFKAFTKAAAQRIFALQQIDGFAFDVEVLLLASKLGYKTESRAVKWEDAKGSTVNKFLDPPKMFLDVLRINSLVKDAVRPKPRVRRLQPQGV